MKISIIGASAGIGLEVTRLALQKEHEVSTLSRRVVPLPDHQKLRRVQGSATNPNDVRAAVEGADAVLVTLGVKSPFATTLFSDSARILLQTIREMGSSPTLIVLTGFGAGDSWGYNSIPMKVLFTLFLKRAYVDKSEQEQLIASGYSRWAMVRPGRLTNGAMTGHYRVLDNLEEGMRVGAISRADVAHF
ncbi:MAG: NAD(P)H-binding protein, partial [Nitrospira sp.]|nr:NAD(P)H-binding protein [Nitrospira sp.]